MTKKQAIVLVLAAVALFFALQYLWTPGVAPRGQQPVVGLSNANFAAFQQAFDEDAGVPRLVLLLSPT